MPLDSVVINEVLTHTDPPLEDAIELYNPTDAPVNIGGWFLSDSQKNFRKFRIPDGTVIGAAGYHVFYQYQFDLTATDGSAGFALNSADGDSVYLSAVDAQGNLTGARAAAHFIYRFLRQACDISDQRSSSRKAIRQAADRISESEKPVPGSENLILTTGKTDFGFSENCFLGSVEKILEVGS